MDLNQEKENGNRLICPFGQTVTWQETAAAKKKNWHQLTKKRI